MQSHTPYNCLYYPLLEASIHFLCKELLALAKCKSFAIPILIIISLSHRPSAVIILPKYLNLFICSTLTPSITRFTIPSPLFDTIMTFVFFTFICLPIIIFIHKYVHGGEGGGLSPLSP